ncbi:carbohydrate ABC transporter permease [Shuttleworthella satelles]|uniref:ABC transporter, permease protein n=1 Tax=Shuttleworthella satelles DSM 14600 TaxID=626523 RepID=C4GDD9_9FIRM|nr:carbohydrate ABC transporter permease [Shuttleworthia satelles]EEP27418.1 ABC transporter, permease protein [Shuttleworthia satelles DSM 14600]
MHYLFRKRAKKSLYWIVMIAFLVIQAYPILWLLLAAFRSNRELLTEPFSWPHELTLENFIKIFEGSHVLTYIKNSAIISVISLVFIVFLSSMASFAIAKMKFMGRKKIYRYFLIGLTIPYAVTLIPLFTMFSRVGLIDHRLSVILPLLAFQLPVSIMLFTNFYRFIPDEVIEAAIIDGSSIYGVYTKIIMPLSLNTILTVVAMNFITVWNDYTFSLVFINSTALKTVSLGLTDFIGPRGLKDWGATYAAIATSILPTLLLYFGLNKKITSGMTLGAVKS